jgi:hypothetical protein
MIMILSKPYDLLEHKKFRYLISFGGATFVIIFSLIFKPFGLYNLSFVNQLYWMSLYVIGGLIIQLIFFFIVQPRLITKFSIGNTILWFFIILIFISFYGFIINAYLLCNGVFRFINFLTITAAIMIDGLLPLSLIILIHYSLILKNQLTKVNEINSQLSHLLNDEQNPKIEIPAENPKNNLKIPLHSLLFISSADNYATIHYIKNEKNTRELIRNTLTQIADAFDNKLQVIRCHRSFIINLSNVEKIITNTSGYYAKIRRVEDPIPISRIYSRKVLSSLKYKL